jgi:hypothetical protein
MVSISYTFYARILRQYFGPKNYKVVFWVWNFLAPKYWQKSEHKMLMKLTHDCNLLFCCLLPFYAVMAIYSSSNEEQLLKVIQISHLLQYYLIFCGQKSLPPINLRPGDNFINISFVLFCRYVGAKKIKNPNYRFVIFGTKISEHACKMLMKLTPVEPFFLYEVVFQSIDIWDPCFIAFLTEMKKWPCSLL